MAMQRPYYSDATARNACRLRCSARCQGDGTGKLARRRWYILGARGQHDRAGGDDFLADELSVDRNGLRCKTACCVATLNTACCAVLRRVALRCNAARCVATAQRAARACLLPNAQLARTVSRQRHRPRVGQLHSTARLQPTARAREPRRRACLCFAGGARRRRQPNRCGHSPCCPRHRTGR
jgi:hypothetical protein